MSAHPAFVSLSSWSWSVAGDFYRRLFGWELDERADHRRCMAGGNVAAVVDEGGYWTGWRLNIAVDDVDAAVGRVEASGGLRVPGGAGTVVSDPAGATVALVAADQGSGSKAEPGCWVWSQLNAVDPAASAAFYEAVFGWHLGSSPNGTFGYQQFQTTDEVFGALMTIDERSGLLVPPVWQIYFHTTDVDASVASVRELGGRVLVEPTDITPGRFAVCLDPAGAMFALECMREPATVR